MWPKIPISDWLSFKNIIHGQKENKIVNVKVGILFNNRLVNTYIIKENKLNFRAHST